MGSCEKIATVGLTTLLFVTLQVGTTHPAQAPGGPPAGTGVSHQGLDAKLDEILENQSEILGNQGTIDGKLNEVLDNQAVMAEELVTIKTLQLRCGSGLNRFVDLGLTVFDCKTNLEWEKKTGEVGDPLDCSVPGDCSDPQDVNNQYTWSADNVFVFDGTAKTDFLGKLNGADGGECFAGHCDWRLPEIRVESEEGTKEELGTIVDCSFQDTVLDPCIDPIFGPTTLLFYWSAVPSSSSVGFAWTRAFGNGDASIRIMTNPHYVRAVRTGP